MKALKLHFLCLSCFLSKFCKNIGLIFTNKRISLFNQLHLKAYGCLLTTLFKFFLLRFTQIMTLVLATGNYHFKSFIWMSALQRGSIFHTELFELLQNEIKVDLGNSGRQTERKNFRKDD